MGPIHRGLKQETGTAVNEEVLRSRHRVSRRRALAAGGWVSLGGLLAACGQATPAPQAAASVATPAPVVDTITALLDGASTCTATKANIEGPYWFDVESVRSDIREDRPGTPLTVALRVHDTSTCAAGGAAVPVPNAVVELWHCDAGGIYSGFEVGSRNAKPFKLPPGGIPASGAPVGGPPEGAKGAFDGNGAPSNGAYSTGDSQSTTTDDGTYLRGAQVTDASGVAQFTTIFPGWYVGRTVHIHVKVHRDKATVLTTQLYFDEDVIEAAHSVAPYAEHTGRDTTDDTDAFFDKAAIFTMGATPSGQVAAINIGIAAAA